MYRYAECENKRIPKLECMFSQMKMIGRQVIHEIAR
jgi:hypothetical protein